MNNDALVAALGMDAVAAVHGYRRLVLREAERRGLRLVSEALSEIVRDCAQAHIIDPIDIRLAFQDCPGRPELVGRVLRWVRRTAGRSSGAAATRRCRISPGRAPDRSPAAADTARAAAAAAAAAAMADAAEPDPVRTGAEPVVRHSGPADNGAAHPAPEPKAGH